MSGRECGRCDTPVGEQLPGEQSCESGQDRSVRPGWAWFGDLATQHGELVA